MSTIEARALSILQTHGPMRGSDPGWALWGQTTAAPGRGIGSHGQNKFCRPAGKLLRRMAAAGLVREQAGEACTAWHAAAAKAQA